VEGFVWVCPADKIGLHMLDEFAGMDEIKF
jgi:hypothetical protein